MRILFLLSLIGFCYMATAQTQVINSSTFDKNDGWGLIENEKATFRVEGGYYKLTHKRTESGWSANKQIGIDPEKNFFIETKVLHKDGVTNYKYGIYLYDIRKTKSNISYYFCINSDSYFLIYSYNYETKKSVYYQEWKQLKDVVKSDENTLVIQKAGDETIFYINETEVFRTTKDFYGSSLGVVLDNAQEVWYDYITVKQDKGEIKLAAGSDTKYQLENLGDSVNCEYDDLTPIITADEKTLYFSRKEHPENLGDEHKDDIWYSTKNDDGSWAKCKNVGPPLNNDGHNFIVSVVPDNNTVLIANTYNPDGTVKGSGLSISNRTVDGWEIPRKIEIEDYYNDSKYVDYCMSPDKNVLLICAERADSYGERDIYACFRKSETGFSKPVNLGPVVNSFTRENSPFIAADNASLYYSSAGKPGYGGLDVFVTRRLDDSWTKWSEPENLGPNINTENYEMGYNIPASGNYAYMVSNTVPGKMGDIYKVKVPEASKPKPVVLIHGKVLNSKTRTPLEAEISYTNLATNSNVGNARSNPSTGEYQIVLPYGVNYGFSADKTGFYPISENIDVTRLDKYTEIEKDLYLTPLETGTTIRLNNIFFDFNKSDLLPESYSELDKLIATLEKNPGFVIEISGHTDNVGSDEHNLALSKKRAEIVVKYLTDKGVRNTLTAKGYGETNPVANNDTEEGRQMNRRVEFSISK